MRKKYLIAAALLALLAFAFPIEHKYDKLFRVFSLSLIPDDLFVSKDYGRKIYFYISDIVALILLSLSLFSFRTPLRKFFGNPLWIVFLCALISIMASPFAHYPTAYTRLLQLLTPIILFSFLATTFDEEERRKITRIFLIATVASGLCQTAIAIAQYFHQAPLGLRILGEASQPCTFPVVGGGLWLIDRFIQSDARTFIMRASGTLSHPNVLGGFLVISLLSTYLLILQAKRRWFLILTLPFQLFALYVTYSRSALFAWILSTLIWLSFMVYQRGFKDRLTRNLALAIALSFALISTALVSQYTHRGGVLNYNAVAQGSDSVRLFQQKLGLRILKDHPLIGLGYGQFSERAGPYFPPGTDPYVRSTAPHNIFLFLACETGLISLTALLSLIAILLRSVLRSQLTPEIGTFTALFIGFLFIGFCDFYPLIFHQGKLMFFFVAGLLAAHVQRTQNFNARTINA